MKTFTLEDFFYDKDSRTLSVDASDLFGKESVATAITVKSVKTGVVKIFKYVRCNKDREGDLESWTFYESESETKMVIFND